MTKSYPFLVADLGKGGEGRGACRGGEMEPVSGLGQLDSVNV